MEKRRTNPGFLSDEEAARERERTSEIVRSIAGNSPMNRKVRRNANRKQVARFVKNPIKRIGETDCFLVDFNYQDRVVVVYGKEIPKGCPFKLRFTMSDTSTVICFLEKANAMLDKEEVTRIGERKNLVVDYDGNQRQVIVYQSVSPECEFKLAFNESETVKVINLLKIAKSFF